jgi:RimJ/RimL family protein N-acetyltransferase
MAGLDNHLAALALLGGDVIGAVYADNAVNPRCALLWTGHRFFLAGRPDIRSFNDGLGPLFATTIAPQALAAGLGGFGLYVAAEAWQPVIKTALVELQPALYPRDYYELTSPPADSWRALIRPGFRLRPVDRALLADTTVVHQQRLAAEVVSEGGTIEDFLHRRFGFCLLAGDRLAGWCLSEFNHKERCEVGIETTEEYLRQGVARATGSALAAHAFSRGITRMGWHCWSGNTASIATALALGYRLEQRYWYAYCRFAQAANPAA